MFYLDKDTTLNVFLEGETQLQEVVVEDRLDQDSKEVQMSKMEISVEQIKKAPALLGEKDVFKTLQLLPGVQKGSEGSSGLYVRGGGPDQNLIILDEATVYNATHLFGFFSLFNGDALKNVELIKGGFPARYGGRLSWADTDPSTTDNYIFQVVYTSYSVHSGSNSSGSFNDTIKMRVTNSAFVSDKEGNQFGKTLTYTHYDKRDSVYTDLITLSKEYTEYRQKFSQAIGSLDSPFSETVPMYSNIEGGLGVFAGFNRFSFRVYP